MNTHRIFTITASNKPLLLTQLDKLNKRAAKFGAEELTVSFSKAFEGKDKVLSLNANVFGPFHIESEGWSCIATLQHLSNGETLISSITDKEIPNCYKTKGSICEHCNINRKRNMTYLLQKDEEIVQVGSSCMKDFFKGMSVTSFLGQADLASDLVKSISSLNVSFGATQYYLPSFLETTAAVIREHGWIPKSKAATMGKPTIDFVLENLCPPTVDYAVSFIEDEDRDLVSKVIAWAENLSDSQTEASDYLFNLRSLALGASVELKTAALAASMIAGYQAAQKFASPASAGGAGGSMGGYAESASEFVGNTGDAYVGELTLSFSRDYPPEQSGRNYTSYMYSFKDSKGNVFLWNTGKDAQLEVGNKYMVKGKIKRHSLWGKQNIKQTEIYYCSAYLMK